MGKHKNIKQGKIFLEFMSKNQDVAQGFTKGTNLDVDPRWRHLVAKLNDEGPPIKDILGWKKVWSDWKSYIRKKIERNKRENLKTDETLRNVIPLTDTEEGIAKITGLYDLIESFTLNSFTGETEINDEISNSNVSIMSLKFVEENFDKPQCENTELSRKVEEEEEQCSDIKNFIKSQEILNKNINKKLDKIIKYKKKCCKYLKKNYRESKRHNGIIEAVLMEKLKHKRRRVEISEIKLCQQYY